MRWREGRRSENVEDRRGMRAGLGGGGLRLGGGTIILLLLGAWLLGINPLQILGLLAGSSESTLQLPDAAPETGPVAAGAPQDEGGDFVSVVLADTEDTWSALFTRAGAQLRAAEARALLAAWCARPAAWRRRRWVPSTARATRRSTSTSPSTVTCASASARPATSRRPT